MAFGVGLAGAVEKSAIKEYQLKAAFLYNFTKFVEWPANSFADTDSPIVIGAFCPASFEADLQKIVKDRVVNGRRIAVSMLSSAGQAASAHVLFVCAAEEGKFGQIQRSLGARPVLTVGESATFAKSGGMITFVLDGDQMRFEINVASAERGHLKISAQLQKLATVVRRGP